MEKVSIQAKKNRYQILGLTLALALGFLCFKITQRVKSAKRKHKAALW